MSSQRALTAVPLTTAEYKPYGHVVAATVDPKDANQGVHLVYTSSFRDSLELDLMTASYIIRPNAKLNYCVFRCTPREIPFEVKLLERHLYSTQSFIPMICAKRYLVVVALNDPKTDKPDLSTLRVFVAAPNQGITYYPGIWHHPMIALDSVTDFACLVYEDGTDDDCHVVSIAPSIKLHVPAIAPKASL